MANKVREHLSWLALLLVPFLGAGLWPLPPFGGAWWPAMLAGAMMNALALVGLVAWPMGAGVAHLGKIGLSWLVLWLLGAWALWQLPRPWLKPLVPLAVLAGAWAALHLALSKKG
ncbi:hypothetical protein [Gallaecimonas pentaromativorans]|uniref:hypothetical protein n=1 Tax=Gallaecimonas pentaromativorans TaxID=584787 RepID=UPI00067F4624|nr:hypothetical protein [Gallaecimonas pentaromativorans]